jgi:hypothetical protein
LPKAVTIKTKDEVWGSHFSHLGVGGFVELPNISYMYDIPVTDTLSVDKLSSGRRKLGMVVYLLEEKKYYQLRPKKTDGTELTMAEWNALTDIQKILKLDPNAAMTDSSYNTVNGSGKPEEAWVEVFTSANSTGDDLINETFNVVGQNIGSYKDGESIAKGEKLEDVVKKILQKRVLPDYEQPLFSISSNIGLAYEVGTKIEPNIIPSWDKKNAGEWVSYELYKNGLKIDLASQNYSVTNQSLSSFNDAPQFVLGSDVSYQAKITWSNGPILKDNLGQDDVANRILSNSSDPRSSNTLTFLAKRAVFYTADLGVGLPSDSSEIRSFSPRIDISKGQEFNLTVGALAKRVVIAYPKDWGEISRIEDTSLKADIKGGFFKREFEVEANSIGYKAMYYVYTLTLAEAYGSTVIYKVTI